MGERLYTLTRLHGGYYATSFFRGDEDDLQRELQRITIAEPDVLTISVKPVGGQRS